MHPEIEELRPRLKEILYDCAVQIRATKAALYFFDHPSGKFELVTEYGFRGSARAKLDKDDAIIDRCGRGRSPYYVNGLATEPRFSEFLYEASTDRLLAAPLYSRGQLIGVIDMRDKAGKQPFEQGDVSAAQKIAERVINVVADRNVFGQRFIVLSDSGETGALNAPVPVSEPTPLGVDAPQVSVSAAPEGRPALPAPPLAPPVPPAAAPPVDVVPPALAEARAAMTRIVIPPAPESLTEAALDAVRDVLRSMLVIPGAVAATFSAYGHLGGVQETVASSGLTADAAQQLQAKLNVWMSRRGESVGSLKARVSTLPGASGPPLTAEHLRRVFTAPVVAGSLRGLYLTVAFSGEPDRTAHDLLTVLLKQIQLSIEHAMDRGALQTLRVRAAEVLLEPDLTRSPRLKRHAHEVAALAARFAEFLGLKPAEVDDVRVVGLAHDAGMRLLGGERLYGRGGELSAEETELIREHPAVSAALAEPVLGREVARAILCHHERADGRGYPNELQGNEIPLLSRIVQICDAWVAITDAETYRQPERPEAAMSILGTGAGSQFDRDLVLKFQEMMLRR